MPRPDRALRRIAAALWVAVLWLAVFSGPGLAAEAEQDETAVGEAMLQFALRPWTGDLPGMAERGVIRVLTVPNRIFFFTDRFKQYGITFEAFRAFEADLNKRLKLGKSKHVTVVFIPVSRDLLIPWLLQGIGDIAAGNLTITPERAAQVSFSLPFTEDVREVLVTGVDAPAAETLEDLAGREIVVRRSSSYYESLTALNAHLREAGKEEVRITLADENLEDDDIAEMVNAGLYPAMVMDLHKAELWAKVFDRIAVKTSLVLRSGGEIAWAFRKDSPELEKAVNAFVSQHKVGTEGTNVLIKRYLKDTRFVKNALAESEREQFAQTVELFKKYGGQYGFDWLLLIAQGYQESSLRHSVRSKAGAVGIMQVLPSTAARPPIEIADVTNVESNIHAGVKYLRFMVDTYFDDPGISVLDRHLFAFAAYNAGPTRISGLRRKAAEQGLDPNKWFNNVELLVSKHVGREPTQYVRNIFKYYIAYRRIEEQQGKRAAVRKELAK